MGSYLERKVYTKHIGYQELTDNSISKDSDPETIESDEDFDKMVGVLSKLYLKNSAENLNKSQSTDFTEMNVVGRVNGEPEYEMDDLQSIKLIKWIKEMKN